MGAPSPPSDKDKIEKIEQPVKTKPETPKDNRSTSTRWLNSWFPNRAPPAAEKLATAHAQCERKLDTIDEVNPQSSSVKDYPAWMLVEFGKDLLDGVKLSPSTKRRLSNEEHIRHTTPSDKRWDRDSSTWVRIDGRKRASPHSKMIELPYSRGARYDAVPRTLDDCTDDAGVHVELLESPKEYDQHVNPGEDPDVFIPDVHPHLTSSVGGVPVPDRGKYWRPRETTRYTEHRSCSVCPQFESNRDPGQMKYSQLETPRDNEQWQYPQPESIHNSEQKKYPHVETIQNTELPATPPLTSKLDKRMTPSSMEEHAGEPVKSTIKSIKDTFMSFFVGGHSKKVTSSKLADAIFTHSKTGEPASNSVNVDSSLRSKPMSAQVSPEKGLTQVKVANGARRWVFRSPVLTSHDAAGCSSANGSPVRSPPGQTKPNARYSSEFYSPDLHRKFMTNPNNEMYVPEIARKNWRPGVYIH